MVQNAGMTRVLLLLPTRTYRTADFLAAADRLGVDVVVGAERRNALESLADGGTMLVRLDDPERGAAMVERYAREHPLDAVVGVDDGSTVVAAAAAERLGLPHNPPDAVRRSRDKAQTRAAFAAAGLATPNFATHSALLDPESLPEAITASRSPSPSRSPSAISQPENTPPGTERRVNDPVPSLIHRSSVTLFLVATNASRSPSPSTSPRATALLTEFPSLTPGTKVPLLLM